MFINQLDVDFREMEAALFQWIFQYMVDLWIYVQGQSHFELQFEENEKYEFAYIKLEFYK